MSQRVLIIDDSKAIHLLIRNRLAAEAIELHSAESGPAGLALVHELRPDLVLLDVELGAVSGFDVCRQLKADPATSGIPVVFLTGSSSTQLKIQGLELGAVDYITKPFDPAELRARVRAALRFKYLMDLLGRKAQIDGLTGLWNRAYFEHRLAEEQSLARRTGDPLSCVLADVDHFKSVNDRFGHPFGDEMLRHVAGVLNEVTRTEDSVCRYGGEEFILLLPNTNAAGAFRLAERIRSELQTRVLRHGETSVPVTLSLGVAENGTTDSPSIVQRADAALYAAKQGGRNRVNVDGIAIPLPMITPGAA